MQHRSAQPLSFQIRPIILSSFGNHKGKIFRYSILLLFVAGITILRSTPTVAQENGVLQINDPIHEYILRQYSRGHLGKARIGMLPLNAGYAQTLLDSLSVMTVGLTPRERLYLDRLRQEANGPGTPLAQATPGPWFDNGHDFFSADGPDFNIQINPIAALEFGPYSRRGEIRESDTYWRNRRGVRLSGRVGRQWFFEARVEEVQEHVIDAEVYSKKTIPRQRYVGYDPQIVESGDSTAVNRVNRSVFDYGPSMGVVGFRSEHVEFRLGRDQYRLGYGINSLFLSNYATEYDHILLNLHFWRFQYTYLLASMRDQSSRSVDGTADRKTALFHRLDVSVSDRFRFELFQSVVVMADPASSSSSAFDIAMLNPLLFLRQFEKDYNRYGNKLIGGGFSFIARSSVRIYGQVLLDEFVANQIFSGKGYWANKWGIVTGLHISDPIDLQIEYSRVTPYTYSHRQSGTSYVHYEDLLGHPAGANFWDVTARLSSRFSNRLTFQTISSITRRGANALPLNYGSDPRLDYESRISDFGIKFLQGPKELSVISDAYLSFELLPRLYIDTSLRLWWSDHEVSGVNSIRRIGFGLRWGMPPLFSRN